MGHVRTWAALGLVLSGAFLHASAVQARTWIIRPDGSGDAPTIQAGIDSAISGDDVRVTAGHYTWTSQGKGTDEFGPTMIEVRFGIRLHSESGATSTVLDAEEQGRVVVCRFCAGVEGFTIIGGRTLRDPFGGGYAGLGGGIFALGGAPILAENIVRSNFAGGSGGGIGTHGGRTPSSTPVIRGNTVVGNVAGYRTGGIEVGGAGSVLIENNTVVGNAGGGIACIDCGGTIARNIVAESTGSSGGLVGGFAFFCFEFQGPSPMSECNILWNNSGGNGICGTDAGGNAIVDPRFCASDPTGSGLRFLRPDSPALPENNACGALIGAVGEGCDVTDHVELVGFERVTMRLAPNPMHDRLTIDVGMSVANRTVHLGIYDLRGRLVVRIPATTKMGSIDWDGRDAFGIPVGAGIYVVRLQTARGEMSRKIVRVR